MRKLRYLFVTLYIITLGYIFYAAASSAANSTRQSNIASQVIVNTIDVVESAEIAISNDDRLTVKDKYETNYDFRIQFNKVVRKLVGHFGLFGFLGIMFSLAFYTFFESKKQLLIINFINGFVTAGISEIIQLFADKRGPAFTDVLIDYSGYLIGSLFIILIMFLVNRKKKIPV